MMLDRTPKFGELLVNTMACEDNPCRTGFYVQTIRRTGRLNPGQWIQMTDGHGKFWQVGAEHLIPAAPVRATGGELRERLLAAVNSAIAMRMPLTAKLLREAAAALNPAIDTTGAAVLVKQWRDMAATMNQKHNLTLAQICMRDAILDCADNLETALSPAIAPAGALTAEMIREAEAHCPIALAPMARWDWMADRLSKALAEPGAACACCGVTADGAETELFTEQGGGSHPTLHAQPERPCTGTTNGLRVIDLKNPNGSMREVDEVLAELAAPQDGEADQPTVIINHVPMPRPPADVLKQVAADMAADQPVGDDDRASVKRWRPETHIEPGRTQVYARMEESETGGFVLFEDYDRLSQQLAATIAERDRAVAALLAAYDAGFMFSGEGCNGEHGPDIDHPYYVKARDEYFAAIAAAAGDAGEMK